MAMATAIEKRQMASIGEGTMTLDAIEQLARDLMKQHGLKGWRFQFDNAVSRYGSCHYRKKLITLSRHLALLCPEDEVRDTILHEIAHALVDESVWHGPEWKAMAVKIGASPVRCYQGEARIPGKWVSICAQCGWQVRQHRRTDFSCINCSNGTYNPKYKMEWVEAPKPEEGEIDGYAVSGSSPPADFDSCTTFEESDKIYHRLYANHPEDLLRLQEEHRKCLVRLTSERVVEPYDTKQDAAALAVHIAACDNGISEDDVSVCFEMSPLCNWGPPDSTFTVTRLRQALKAMPKDKFKKVGSVWYPTHGRKMMSDDAPMVRICEAPRCKVDISHRPRQTHFCSRACRQKVARRQAARNG